MKYIPALDGLRALAVLAVVGLHSHAPGFSGGSIGVDVFFVLSGYLITRLISETQPRLRDFYVRRFFRLTPPLVFMLAAYVAAYSVLVPGYPHYRDALISLLYLSDYARAFWHVPEYVTHTWSLSVEEHFYLLWPIVLLRCRPSIKALALVYLAATVWRWLPDQADAYVRFDTRIAPLILGCMMASVPRGRFPAWPWLLALGAFCVINPWQWQGVGGAIAISAVELSAAAAILGRSPAWMEHRWLVYLGRLSYGIYLWHVLISVYLVEIAYASWQEAFLWSLGGSVALAALSYHTVEAISRNSWSRAGSALPGQRYRDSLARLIPRRPYSTER